MAVPSFRAYLQSNNVSPTYQKQQPTKEETELMVCVECFIYNTDG
jgi:hypothetical protein